MFRRDDAICQTGCVICWDVLVLKKMHWDVNEFKKYIFHIFHNFPLLWKVLFVQLVKKLCISGMNCSPRALARGSFTNQDT